MGLVSKIWTLITDDVGIDLGTANTKVAIGGEGIIATEPSVVAMNTHTKDILAVGADAKRMLGRTPANIVAVRPLRDGVISDFEATRDMIEYFINLAYSRSKKFIKLPRPRVIIGVPSSASEIGKKAVHDAAKNAGARDVFVIEEPMAAAIGSNLPITEAVGSMIVDIGGGTTDIAIISLGSIVVDKTVAVAGDQMDEEIVKYVRHKYNLLIGERMAEDIKIRIGSAYPLKKETTYEVRGRDILQGVPRTLTLSSIEVREAISVQLNQIVLAMSEALEEAPPEILADIGSSGIIISGGGANIPGLKDLFEEKVKMKVTVADEPIECVVRGTQLLLEDIELLARVKENYDYY
ncbi:MAG: rod shape-determining protein [Candidatus Dojkabacteria bacterium]